MKNSAPSELRQRFYTAVGLLLFTYYSIFYTTSTVFISLQTLLFSLIGWEWVTLCAPISLAIQLLYMSCLLAGYVGAYFFLSLPTLCILSTLISFSMIVYMIYLMQKPVLLEHSAIFKRSMGIVSLILAWKSLLFLRSAPYYLVLGLITIILTDTSAYLIGKKWGSHPCAPLISPRKTWEGSIAGLFLPVFISMFILRMCIQPPKLHFLYWFINFFMTTLTALAGDLFESQIKRERGVKDSGSILPGHGGLSDRFDSILMSITVFTAGFYWIQSAHHISL